MWPHEEISIERFGLQSQDLDKVRTDFSSFIYFDTDLLAFMIHGESQGTVSGALKALTSVLCECATRESAPVRLFLVDPPPRQCRDYVVEMIRADDMKSPSRAFGVESETNQKVVRLTKSASPSEQIGNWEESMTKFFRTNIRVFELAFSDCMSRMLYYRGNIHMRCKIGTFVFERYRWIPKEAKVQSTSEFIENMRESSTEGTLNGT